MDELSVHLRARTCAQVLLFCVFVVGCGATEPIAPAPGIEADVAYLASPALQGRGAGTAGGDSAAAYIARTYQRMGLQPAFQAVCSSSTECPPSFFQFFDVEGSIAQNVAVMVPGTDPSLSDRYVVVGAHLDHLGTSTRGALDPEQGGAVRPGADDNASGTAAVLELGRRLARRPAPEPVLLVHFDAEESGLVGSRVFVAHLPIPRAAVLLMINLDMVGRLRTGGLTIDPSATPDTVLFLADSAAHALGLNLKHNSVTAQRSDHASFARAGLPAISFFTGFHSDYHRTSDVASRVDVRGIEKVVDVAEAVVRGAAGLRSRIER